MAALMRALPTGTFIPIVGRNRTAMRCKASAFMPSMVDSICWMACFLAPSTFSWVMAVAFASGLAAPRMLAESSPFCPLAPFLIRLAITACTEASATGSEGASNMLLCPDAAPTSAARSLPVSVNSPSSASALALFSASVLALASALAACSARSCCASMSARVGAVKPSGCPACASVLPGCASLRPWSPSPALSCETPVTGGPACPES